jgi:hypothetical protein
MLTENAMIARRSTSSMRLFRQGIAQHFTRRINVNNLDSMLKRDFKDGKPGDKALHATCFPCHIPAKERDYVFTRYAP